MSAFPRRRAKRLYYLIGAEKWDEASRRCQTHPQDARWKTPGGWLPIHQACDRGAPLSLIRQLLPAYREGVKTTTNANYGGWLPLHLACMGTSLEVVEYLHCQYPDGATKKDSKGRTPADKLNVNPFLSEEDKAKARTILSTAQCARTSSPRPITPTAAKNATTSTTNASIPTVTTPNTMTSTTTSTKGGSASRQDAPSSPTTLTWPTKSSAVAIVEGKGGGGGEAESVVRKGGTSTLPTQAGGDVLSPPGDAGGREPKRAPADVQRHRPAQTPSTYPRDVNASPGDASNTTSNPSTSATTSTSSYPSSHDTSSSPTTSKLPSKALADEGVDDVHGKGSTFDGQTAAVPTFADHGHDAAPALTTEQHQAIQALTKNLHDIDRSLEAVRGLPASLSGSPGHVQQYFRSFVTAFERTYVAAQALSTGAIQGQLMDKDMLVAALENLGTGAEACGVPFAGAISIFASLALHQMQTRQDNLLCVYQQFFAGDSLMSHHLVYRSAAEHICLSSDLSAFSGGNVPHVFKLRAKVGRLIERLEKKLQKCHLLPVGSLDPIEVKVMDDLATIAEAVMTLWFHRRSEYVRLKDAKDHKRVEFTLDALGLGELSPITSASTANAETVEAGSTSHGNLPANSVNPPIRRDIVAQTVRPRTSSHRIVAPPNEVKELKKQVLRLEKRVAKLTPNDDDETVDVGGGHNQSQAVCYVSKHSREKKRPGKTASQDYNPHTNAMNGDIQDVREIVHALSLDNFMTRRVLSVVEARKFIQQVLMCSKGDHTGGNPEGLHHHKSVSVGENGRFRLNGKSYRIGYVEGHVGPSKKLWDGKSEIRFDLDSYGARSVKYWFVETGLEHRYHAHGKEIIRHMFAKELPN